MNPAGVIGGQAARRNHAVNMGMVQQVLSPGVEDAEEANLRAQVLGVGRDFEERRSAGMEEQTVKDALVLIGERSQWVRQGEDHMNVTNGQ